MRGGAPRSVGGLRLCLSRPQASTWSPGGALSFLEGCAIVWYHIWLCRASWLCLAYLCVLWVLIGGGRPLERRWCCNPFEQEGSPCNMGEAIMYMRDTEQYTVSNVNTDSEHWQEVDCNTIIRCYFDPFTEPISTPRLTSILHPPNMLKTGWKWKMQNQVMALERMLPWELLSIGILVLRKQLYKNSSCPSVFRIFCGQVFWL